MGLFLLATSIFFAISTANAFNGDMVSIGKSDFRLGNLGFKEQANLADEILDGLGEIRIQGTLLPFEFDIDGNPAKAKRKAYLGFHRRAHYTNIGEVDNDGYPTIPFRSVYTVVDEARHELRFESEISFTPIFRYQPLNVYAGVGVKRLYQVDNLNDYRNRRSSEEALKEIFVNTDLTEEEIEANHKARGSNVFKALSGLFSSLDNVIRDGASYFADEERTKIFFDNLFDPLRLDAEFFRINAEKIRDSENIQDGEILVHSVALRFLPSGFSLKRNVARLDLYPKTYTIVLHSAFKKKSPKEVLAKSILEIRRGTELVARINLIGTKIPIARHGRSSENIEIQEFAYNFDLTKPDHVLAFDDIFSKRWFSRDIRDLPTVLKNPEIIQNSDYLTFTRNRDTPLNALKVRSRIELLFLRYRNREDQRLEKIVTSPVNDEEIVEYSGTTSKLRRFELRLGHKRLNANRRNERSLRTYVREANSNTDHKTDIVFDFVFNDRYTNKGVYENDVEFIRMASAANLLASNSEVFRTIDEILNSRLNSKSKKIDSQYLGLRLSLSEGLIERIFSNDDNLENIKFFIGRLFMGDQYSQWSDIAFPRTKPGARDRSCRHLLVNDNALVFNLSQAHTVSCFALGRIAQNLYDAYAEIHNASSSQERLFKLNQMFRNRDHRAYIPLLILQLATIDKIQNNEATYINADELIDSAHLGLELLIDGDDIDFPVSISYNNTRALQRLRMLQDFEVLDIDHGDKRLQPKGVYAKSSEIRLQYPDIYFKVNSIVKLPSDYKVYAKLHERRFIRSDIFVDSFIISNIDQLEALTNRLGDYRVFSYSIKLNNEQRRIVKKNKDYVLTIQVIDGEGNFVTEEQKFLFNIR